MKIFSFLKKCILLLIIVFISFSCEAENEIKNNNENKNPPLTTADYTFKDRIDENILKNFLSRSITLSFMSVPSDNPQDDIQLIKRLGAKYISRAIIPWEAETNYTLSISQYKRTINLVHQLDPDVILEACIFETVFPSVNNVKIPEWVFESFQKPVEKRNFNYDKMLFSNNKYYNHWGGGGSVPDITQLETQMYFYFRACKYIDAGFEGIHWGQVLLIGEDERHRSYPSYFKLFDKVRKYAKSNSRRGFVLHNAHTHGITDADGNLLFDFHSFPIRNRTPDGAKEHEVSETTPQKTILEEGHIDAIYNKSKGGKSPSGWSCESLPYFVEIDNGSGYEENYLNVPGRDYWPWGMDEISWYVNQPYSYRASWLKYAYEWVIETDKNGFLCMPGSRPYYSIQQDRMTWYHANNPKFGDDKIIKVIWESN